MAKRTLKNCSLIRKMGGAPDQHDGKCEGFCTQESDEPCDICMRCKLNTDYEE